MADLIDIWLLVWIFKAFRNHALLIPEMTKAQNVNLCMKQSLL